MGSLLQPSAAPAKSSRAAWVARELADLAVVDLAVVDLAVVEEAIRFMSQACPHRAVSLKS